MLYALAADAVMAIHFLFVAFVAAGSFLVLWRGSIAWLQLPALAWGAWITASGRICPLTPLENRLRALAGEDTYGSGFIAHYLEPVLYPPGLTRNTQVVLLAILIVTNCVGYGLAVSKSWRGRARA